MHKREVTKKKKKKKYKSKFNTSIVACVYLEKHISILQNREHGVAFSPLFLATVLSVEKTLFYTTRCECSSWCRHVEDKSINGSFHM